MTSTDLTFRIPKVDISECIGLCSYNELVYATSYTSGQLYKIDPNSKLSSQVGDLSAYSGLHGIADDNAGNLYISATISNKIIKCDIDGNNISTFDVTPYGSGPTGILYINDFNIYVSLYYSGKIISIDSSLNYNGTVATGLNGPQSITQDNDGLFYVSEYDSNKVSKWNSDWTSSSSTFISVAAPTGIVYYSNYIFVSSNTTNNVNQYNLNGQQITIFTDNVSSPYNILFITYTVTSGGNITTYQNFVEASYGGNGAYFYSFNNITCFSENTKILTLNNGIEEYVSIKNLKKGDLVKSYLHGYRKIDLIGKGNMFNNPEKITTCMYILEKTEENNLIEDLIITGGHSILVDKLTEEESKKQSLYWKKEFKIDDKMLLLAGVSSLLKQITDEKMFTYYHFTLENNGNDDERFGVYANGVLVETPSKKQFQKFKIEEL
jgi:streptogramin lyase